ncbi:MFP1 attachment factor 1-like protein [Tanacetum coccineum]
MSFSIWPPTKRTREAIEDEAFNKAGDVDDFKVAGKGEAGDQGLVILQIYGQEISKRMLEFVKARCADFVKVEDVKEEESGEGVVDVEN